MKLEQFKNNFASHFDDLFHPTSFTDAKYNLEYIPSLPHGFTTCYTGHLINYANSLLNSNEAHLQIGYHCARTLAYGMYNQLDKFHYLINDFSDCSDLEQPLEHWLQITQNHNYLKMVYGNSMELLSRVPPILKHKIGVCFYDQSKDYETHLKTLELLEPYLADSALIIINNINCDEQRHASYAWIKNSPNAQLLFDLPTPSNGFPTWWNGIHIIGYKRGIFNKFFHFNCPFTSKKKEVVLLSASIEEGGSEEIIFNIAKYLDNSKYRVTVACFYGGPMLEVFQENNILCYIADGNTREERLQSIQRYLQNLEPAYLICNYVPDGHFIAPTKTKTIELIHGVYNWLTHDQQYNLALQKASKIICVSHPVREFMSQNYPGINQKLVVIENGIDERKTKPSTPKEAIRKNLGIPEDGIVLGTLGRISHEKALERIIQLAKILNDQYSNLYFIIPGNAQRHIEYFNLLQALIENSGLKNIIFPGFFKNSADLLQIYDILLFSSIVEGLQLALIEGLKIGLPVVTTNVGVVRFDQDIIDGEIGFILDEYSDQLFSEKVSLLIENEDLRSSIGERNRQVFANKYTALEMVKKYDLVLQKLKQ